MREEEINHDKMWNCLECGVPDARKDSICDSCTKKWGLVYNIANVSKFTEWRDYMLKNGYSITQNI